jgi:ATP-dependent Clp protease ATP-binding subunit ClpA
MTEGRAQKPYSVILLDEIEKPILVQYFIASA